MKSKLVVFDVMPLLYRGHFAFLSRPMTNSKGVNISAAYIFSSVVRDMVAQAGVTHCALAMDSSPTFRHEKYPSYKAKRDKMPEDIADSIPIAEEFARAMRIPFLRVEKFEADDIMGTLSAMAEAASAVSSAAESESEGFETVLVSPDKDIAQLVSDSTVLCRPAAKSGGPGEIYDAARVREEWGIDSPSRMVDLLGIAGDAADNIPGIPGVGPKTAAQLLAKYGGVEEILAGADGEPPKLAEKLRAGAESARASRWLAEIRRDVPLGVSLEDLARKEPDEAAVREFCAKYDLNSLLTKILGKGAASKGAAAGSGGAGGAGGGGAALDGLAGARADAKFSVANVPHVYRLCGSEAELDALAARLAGAGEFVFDTESTGLDTRRAELVGISFALSAHEAFYVPVEVGAGGADAAAGGGANDANGVKSGANGAASGANGAAAATQLSLFDAPEPEAPAPSAPAPKESAPATQLSLFDEPATPAETLAEKLADKNVCSTFSAAANAADATNVSNAADAATPDSAPDGSAAAAAARPFPLELIRAKFAPVFADARIKKIGHNLKFDLHILRNAGIEVAGPLSDSMLAHYVFAPDARHGMDALALECLDYKTIHIEELIGAKGKDQILMSQAPLQKVAEYAAEDADITLQLHDILLKRAQDAGAGEVLQRCENPLIRVLFEMEREGVRIDTAALTAYSRELESEINEIEARVLELAGESFNLASPKQLGFILFDTLKLPHGAKTSTGAYSTSDDVLQDLKPHHPIIAEILEYRACSKLKSTYVDKLPQCIHAGDGRIHTSFNQALAETGRLSSDNPNLQNIPIRTERGRRIRAAFVPRDPGHALVSADYSQIELRVVASISGDEAMIAAFNNGADIHQETASRVYGVPASEVTKEMRSHCKQVNFGIIYGISAFGLAQRLGIARTKAAELISAYFDLYPGVKNYMEKAVADAREKGYAETLFGRRRPIPGIDSRNGTVRASAERNAINTPIQGAAADLIKLAMIAVSEQMRSRGMRSKLILQVHDELVFDARKDELAELFPLVEAAMTNVAQLAVPLRVEIGSGESWLAAH